MADTFLFGGVRYFFLPRKKARMNIPFSLIPYEMSSQAVEGEISTPELSSAQHPHDRRALSFASAFVTIFFLFGFFSLRREKTRISSRKSFVWWSRLCCTKKVLKCAPTCWSIGKICLDACWNCYRPWKINQWTWAVFTPVSRPDGSNGRRKASRTRNHPLRSSWTL